MAGLMEVLREYYSVAFHDAIVLSNKLYILHLDMLNSYFPLLIMEKISLYDAQNEN